MRRPDLIRNATAEAARHGLDGGVADAVVADLTESSAPPDRESLATMEGQSDSSVTLAMALFTRWFGSTSWHVWHVALKALFGEPITAEEMKIYRQLTSRERVPARLPREAYVIAGRRSGKTIISALIAVLLAAFRSYRHQLQHGERGVVMILAADRRQATVALRYVEGLFAVPELEALVIRRTRDGLTIMNDEREISIEVHTSNYRTVRGYTLIGAIADELAFWPADGSASPDVETLAAIRPAMASVRGALLLCISSPYARRGALWEADQKHFGRAESSVLVLKGPSTFMNPTLDPEVVAAAYEADPPSAAAEYGAEFRVDVEGFLTHETVKALVVSGRQELAPVATTDYWAFADPSGGSGKDSFTFAIAHRDGTRIILDCLREVRPPFSPDDVVRELSETLSRYALSEVWGDKYAGDWPTERFAIHGIRYHASHKPKSELYRAMLPRVNARELQLLDHPRLVAQLCALERRVARGGRDSIDHPPHGHDDLANVLAGCVDLVGSTPEVKLWGMPITRDAGQEQVAAALEEKERREASAAMIADTIARDGWWWPGSR